MPESKSQGKEKIWVVCADYDGCFESANSQPLLNHFLERDEFRSWGGFHAIKDRINVGDIFTSLPNLDHLRSRYSTHKKIRKKFDSLNEKLNLFLTKYVKANKSLDFMRDEHKLEVEFIKNVVKFNEELTHVCLMGDLLNAGYLPGEDIRIMNGSYRQNNHLDNINEEHHHNGTVRENHVKWGEKLRAYFPELGETTITVDTFTSLDQSDGKAGNVISSESTDQKDLKIDPSKLGLVLSQMHRAKRASPDKEIIFIFFDDKNTEFYGYYIDEAMLYISKDPSLIPQGVTFSANQFNSYAHLNPENTGGPLFTEIAGTGPVRNCGFFDSVVKAKNYNAARKALKELSANLDVFDKNAVTVKGIITVPQGFCQRLSQCCCSLFSCFGGATANASSPGPKTPLLDP